MSSDIHFLENKQAFEELFKLYHKVLKLYAKRFVIETDAAEDIVQDVFVNLWKTRKKIIITTSLKSYLFTAVYNQCLNYLKKTKKVQITDISEKEEADNLKEYYYEHVIYKKKSLIRSEISKDIKQAIDKLPEQQRRVIILSRKFGLKNREIAEFLDISIKVVEKHVSKALYTLRDYLKEYLSSLL